MEAFILRQIGRCVGALALVLNARGLCGEAVSRSDLGTKVKLRVLVDKVMQPQEKWVTKEWMVKATAEAGFNALSPRIGHERLDEVKQVAEWCRTYGIYYMPWMRGSLEAPRGREADGKRYVQARGVEQQLWRPNSDEVWAWTHRHVLEYAKLGVAHRSLMGVFLDYENYAPGRAENCYGLSYDDLILTKFAESKGITAPVLDFAQRKPWLEEKGLHEAFSRFQVDHWRARCRALREAVDRIDPTFQFCIYPAPGTPFMVQGAYPEWATKRAPLILADASTYGRPTRLGGQAASLEANRERLIKGIETPQAAGIPYLYIGGIDPLVRGADPEFSGKNAVMISEATHGYWIFYEGPTYTKPDHVEYWKWFTWANRAIERADFAVWREPRQGGEDVLSGLVRRAGESQRLIPPKVTGVTVTYPHVALRGENILLLAVRKGQRAEILLRHHPVSTYQDSLCWELRDGHMKMIGSGKIALGKEGLVAFTPESDGLYNVVLCAEGCAYSVVQSNVPVGLFAGQGVSLIRGAERLYFAVPDGVERFTVTTQGAGRETVRVNVCDPEGKTAASGQTTFKQNRVRVTVRPGANAGKTWSLSIGRADEGTLEDNQTALDVNVAPVLSFVPDQVFCVGR